MESDSRQASIEEALPIAVERLRREFAPIGIYQFGSSAAWSAGPASDLDLLVVVERSDEDFIARTQRAYRLMRGLPVPIDLLVYTRREFEERASLPISFERTVRTRGRMVYAA